MSGSLDVWMSRCLDVWISGSLVSSPPHSPRLPPVLPSPLPPSRLSSCPRRPCLCLFVCVSASVYVSASVWLCLSTYLRLSACPRRPSPPFLFVCLSLLCLSVSVYVSASVFVSAKTLPPLPFCLSVSLVSVCVCLRICVCFRVRERVCARVLYLAPGRNSKVYGGAAEPGRRPLNI